ncbi:P-loop NTPase fold protein [Terrabacter sp. AAH1]
MAEDVIPDKELTETSDDLFDHDGIAGRAAELLLNSQDPVHIGVFGSWGAGKSSFLQLLANRLSRMDVSNTSLTENPKRRFKIVWYDAWRFSGTALRRDFIAVAARQLSLHGPAYSSGLFESKQVVKLDFDELLRRTIEFTKGVLALLAGLSISVGILSLLGLVVGRFAAGIPSAQEVWTSTVAPNAGKIFALTGAAIAALNLPRLVGVSVSRSSPSQDDEFTDLLSKLLLHAELPKWLRPLRWNRRLAAWVRKRNGHRVVFFIDELDRAASAELVATLTSLQTMLSTVGVPAVLAVDRSVVEHALSEKAHQPGPVRELEPYLATNDAFLDKVFQHQFQLPPLRHERVQTFAKSLVADRGGLWQHVAHLGRLDDVIYALVPAHVRNPRRIKVLLNAFATQYRVAEARQIPVDDHVAELAQWVVLQLEFPDYARDLLHEPRLTSLLRTGKARSEIQQRLISKHSKRAQPESDADDVAWRDWVESDQLHRYLDRTAHIPDVSRSLLYVELAGNALIEVTPETSTVLDEAGDRDPAMTISALKDLSEAERDGAMRFLAERLRSAISEGSDRIVSVLAQLAERQDPDRPLPLASAIEALRSYRCEPESRTLPVNALPGVLRILSEAKQDAWFKRALEQAGALTHQAQAALVGLRLPNTPKDLLVAVDMLEAHLDFATISAIADARNTPMLCAVAKHLPEDVLAQLMPLEDEEDLDAVSAMFEELDRDALRCLALALPASLEDSGSEPAFLALMADAPASDLDTRSRIALAALAMPEVSIAEWAPLITTVPTACDFAPAFATIAAGVWEDGSSQRYWDELHRLGEIGLGDPLAGSMATEFGTSTNTRATDLSQRASLSTRVGELLESISEPNVSDDFANAEAELSVKAIVAGTLQFQEVRDHFVRAMANHATDLEKSFVTASDGQPPASVARACSARLRLKQLHTDLPGPTPREVGEIYKAERATTTAQSKIAGELVEAFFATDPTDRGVITFQGACGYAFGGRLRTWAVAHTATQVTNVWISLFDQGFPASSAGLLSRDRELNVAKATKALTSRMSSGTDARAKAAAFVRAIGAGRPDSGALAQVVAIALAEAGGDERYDAVRLVSEMRPRALKKETKVALSKIPPSFWRSSAAKTMALRVGVKLPRKRSLKRFIQGNS